MIEIEMKIKEQLKRMDKMDKIHPREYETVAYLQKMLFAAVIASINDDMDQED